VRRLSRIAMKRGGIGVGALNVVRPEREVD